MSNNLGRAFFGQMRRELRTRLAHSHRLPLHRPIGSSNRLYKDKKGNDDNESEAVLERLSKESRLKNIVDQMDERQDEQRESSYYNEEGRDVGKIFIRQDVQTIMKSITRFNEDKLFARRPVPKLETPKFVFMTDKQLAEAKDLAYQSVKARMQFPPVMRPTLGEDSTICYEPEIQEFLTNKVIFVDIGMNSSNRDRLMSVRDTNGLLRYPTFDERSRMNHIFFPEKELTIEMPKLFEKDNLEKVLNKGEYEFILNRACLHFEPDDPLYIHITCTTYKHIDRMGHFEKLRSTRHFGPMSLFLAYYGKIDNLLVDMLERDYLDDAADLVRLYYIANNVDEPVETLEDFHIVKNYTDRYSPNKHKLEPALQSTLNKLRQDRASR